LVVRAQQGLAVGVDVAHMGQGIEESVAHLVSLRHTTRHMCCFNAARFIM
jgi:hypothetical protein